MSVNPTGTSLHKTAAITRPNAVSTVAELVLLPPRPSPFVHVGSEVQSLANDVESNNKIKERTRRDCNSAGLVSMDLYR